MKKLNITKIFDQYGWAFFWIAQGMHKHSIHNVIGQKYDEFIYDNQDIMLISSPNIWGDKFSHEVPLECKKRGIKVIGMYSGETKIKYSHVDLIVAISYKFLPWLKETYKDIPVIYLPEAIDDEYFRTNGKFPKNFTVGWCGRPCEVKRPHLLDKLCFPVNKKQNWGPEYWTKDATLDHVRDFYQNINTLILTSNSECMPRVILEAMAMSLPIISTDVGSLQLVVNKNWLVPVPDGRDIQRC